MRRVSRRSSRRGRRRAAPTLPTEDRRAAFADITTEWMWETDAEHRFTYFSPNFAALSGLDPSLLLGRRRDELIMAAGRERWDDYLAAVAARQPFHDLIYRAGTVDGRSRWVRVNGRPVFAGNGRFAGYRGSCRDVTAEIEAEQRWRQAEHRLLALLDSGNDWVWEVDADLHYTYVSPNIAVALGLGADSFIGRRIGGIGALDSDDGAWQHFAASVAAHRPVRDFVFRKSFANGRSIWIKTSCAPLFDAAGRFAGYRGVASDVTARLESERAEQRLARSQRHLVTAQRVARIGSAERDLATEAEEWSDEMYRLAGLAREAAPARLDLLTFLHPEDRDRARRAIEIARSGKQPRPGELRLLRPDGTLRILYVETHIERDEAGNPATLLCIFKDITDHRTIEDLQKETERQLLHAQKLESLGTLAGGVAHELNNTLVPILALTKLAARNLPEGSRPRANLETVLEACERARDLVGRILAFSRKDVPIRRQVDLAALLPGWLKMLRASVPSTIRIEEQIVPVPPLAADPGQLNQVLANLVNNAAQAIGGDLGTIAVALGPGASPGEICLSVSDTGCGMDKTTRARIFEPFFTTKKVGEGTGLGLSVVHGIVAQHGGRIVVESSPGTGAKFIVTLPVLSAEERARSDTAA